MKIRFNSFIKPLGVVGYGLVITLALLQISQPVYSSEPKVLPVNVDNAPTKDTNVGCGFEHLSDDVYALRIVLSSKYEIVDSGIDEKAADGVIWQRDKDDIKQFDIAGVNPNKQFWVIIWARLQPPGEGEGKLFGWMSVSDVDVDADTDNDSDANPRVPAEDNDDNEDFAEYPGYQAPPTVPGLVIGINDDHDEFLPDAQPWERDYDNDSADLMKEGTNYDGQSIGLAQIKLKVNVKRAPGELKFAVPSVIRLFEGEEPDSGAKGSAFAGNRSIDSRGEKTYTFYAEGIAENFDTSELQVRYDPEGGIDQAIDIVTVLPVKMDIDVDSDNSGTVGGTDAEDLLEAKPGEVGMLVQVVDSPSDYGNGKPGVLRGLYSQNISSVLDDPAHCPVITLKKLSGSTGDVRVFKVRAGQDPVLMLDTSAGGGSTTQDGEGGALFDLLADAADHDILITGSDSGEVLLGLQLTLNGAKVALDVVRITTLRVDLDIDSDNNNGFNPPGRTAYEDQIEDKSGDVDYPGKIVVVNDNDDDNDGIPDFADGFNKFGSTSNLTAGEDFVHMILEIAEPIDLTKAVLKLTYEASDPSGVDRTGSGAEDNPYVYFIDSDSKGPLRVWSKPGSVTRNMNSVKADTPGDYVPPGTYNDLATIGLVGSTRLVPLYVEGIDKSASVAEQQIKAEIDPDGSGPLGFVGNDAVRVTVLRVNLLVDTDRDGTINDPKDQKGKDSWTKTRGAVFAVNCDRDGSRVDGGVPVPDAIHFPDSGNPTAEDFLIENAADEQDIAPMVVHKIGPIPNNFNVYLKAGSLEDVQRVHVYKKIEADNTNPAFWGGADATATSGADASGSETSAAETRTEIDVTRWVDPASNDFQGEGTAGDATFGIEGLMFRFVGTNAPPAFAFDGEVDFTLELRKGTTVIASSAVRLKVAPWMMLSRNQSSEEEWAVDASAFNPSNAVFLADLAVDSGGQLHTEPAGARAGTRWFQDHVEIGYTQRPGGPKTHVVFRLPYLGSNPTWPLYNLLASDVAVFQLGVDLGGDSGDFGGNLEILPPDAAHPLGRIVMGDRVAARLKEFLSSQEVQSPVFAPPTMWLDVGHIDEVTSFLAGGVVVIADPTLAWTLISDTARIPATDRHKAVFFASGTTRPEGGTVGGAISTRLYDGPATGSITVVKVATKATGSIATVAKADLTDGETFTIGDGLSTKTFEFDVAGDGVTTGHVVVDVSAGGVTTANDVRDVMVTVINSVFLFAIKAEADGAAKLKLTTALPGAVGNVAVTDTVANAGFVPLGMAGGADDGICNGETVTINDGTTYTASDGTTFTIPKTFQFVTFGIVPAGHVAVNLSAVSTADEVRDTFIAAINNANGTVKAVADGSATVHLWNETKGTAGNRAIIETVNDTGFTVTGMSGGKDDGRDFTTVNWLAVRTFTYTVSGKPDKGQVAHIKSGGRHDGWIEIDTVWNTTSKLVAGGGATAYIFGFTKSLAPRQLGWWNIPTGNGTNPDKYVVVENCMGWRSGTPALVTVEEVLGDADFEALNTTDAQGQIDLVKGSLNAAMTGLVYKSVPCLFFGSRTSFSLNESAIAFNPGPTNLQTVNGHLYIPKQFCPLDRNGTDLFSESIGNALGGANVRWVNDWVYYHLWGGEVHCGTAVKHTVLGMDWWSNQP